MVKPSLRTRDPQSDSSRASPDQGPLTTAMQSRRSTRPNSTAASSRTQTPMLMDDSTEEGTPGPRVGKRKQAERQALPRTGGRPGKKARVALRSSRMRDDDDYEMEGEEEDDEEAETSSRRSRSPTDVKQVKSRSFTPVTTKKREIPVFLTDYSDEWEERHWEKCEACSSGGSRQLVYCQGCAVALHQDCIAGDKKHNVVRIDADAWVLQCRYCISKDDGEKRGGNRSFITGRIGPACEPFVSPKSKWQPPREGYVMPEPEQVARDADAARVLQEQDVLREAIHKPENVMFRCTRCLRPALYEDLPADDSSQGDPSQCFDCNAHVEFRVHLVLGFRELDDAGIQTLEITKAEAPADWTREYLVKWQDHSFRTVEWVSATWLTGFAFAKKRNFDQKELDPIQSIQDVVADDWTKVDVVLDIEYGRGKSFDKMGFESEDEAFAAIQKVKRMYVKWQQVQYEDVSWDDPPPEPAANSSEDDLDMQRWKAFETAYRDWVRGFYVMVDKDHAQRSATLQEFQFGRLEKNKQPKNLVGGELMKYQLDGLNWLYYQYYRRHPAILADEMGLGKTIQIISFLSVLHSDWAIGPFLIVAPNSTISNWKREFQKWAPHMRVAAYYGTASSRSVVQAYEIVHNDTSGQPLKVHALITSYNTIETDAAFLKRYSWACLVVDEGQRLKNDESILFKLLSSFKVNQRVLLTGTPLQNNTKELFNLLQFLDPENMDAEELEAHYDIEKQESLSELHQMLQPYFLRRTKTQVLKFLPPKNEVIVPVTMSALQKELYKTILSKNAELMRLVMSRASSGKPIQNYNNTSLGNVLQQIRKILSHPFIYSPDIEEKVEDEAVSLINLTNACAKLQLLKVLLPLLKAKGHRVLIFCQFIMMLDILEDWLVASGIQHARIDGNTPSPERQESIDQFNAPDSPLTCFLLSTRAGGVGINLATADTVIIYDADFNPHQDLQAVARAHRIGQKSKVVVFTLVTRNTAEEKILQIGRKKMVLDQLIIENMATKEENVPYQEILSFGAAALFEEEAKNELVYDTATVNNLIESSYADMPVVEEEAEDKKDSFGFAKVWAGDTLADEELGEAEGKEATDDLWAKILAQRAAEAKAEADKKSAEFSKGRKRTVKDYSEAAQGKPIEMASVKGKKKAGEKTGSAAETREPTPEKVPEVVVPEPEPEDYWSSDYVSEGDADDTYAPDPHSVAEDAATLKDYATGVLARVPRSCKVCANIHIGGQCQLRNLPVEICMLCGEAHGSGGRNFASQPCPVFKSIPKMRKVLEDLRQSKEPPAIVEKATAFIRGAIGSVTRSERDKKQKELQRQAQSDQQELLPQQPLHSMQQPAVVSQARATQPVQVLVTLPSQNQTMTQQHQQQQQQQQTRAAPVSFPAQLQQQQPLAMLNAAQPAMSTGFPSPGVPSNPALHAGPWSSAGQVLAAGSKGTVPLSQQPSTQSSDLALTSNVPSASLGSLQGTPAPPVVPPPGRINPFGPPVSVPATGPLPQQPSSAVPLVVAQSGASNAAALAASAADTGEQRQGSVQALLEAAMRYPPNANGTAPK